MTKKLWLSSSAAAALALGSSSCYYDAYGYGYGGGPVYGGGYVDSGYIGGGSTFIYTSSDRWFFDPVVYCYYDRHRSCYYDPYLGGYYPRGYCPRPIYGAPYPGGWRPGRGVCPPPSGFRDRNLSNYHNRVDLLRQRNYGWAGSIRERNDSGVSRWQNDRLRQAQGFPNQGGRNLPSSPGRGPQFSQQGTRPGNWGGASNSAFGGRPQVQAGSGRPQPWGGQYQNNRPGYNQPVTSYPGSNRGPVSPQRPNFGQIQAPQYSGGNAGSGRPAQVRPSFGGGGGSYGSRPQFSPQPSRQPQFQAGPSYQGRSFPSAPSQGRQGRRMN